MKKVIWIIGSNSSGKTTASKLIHKNFNGKNVKEIRKIDFVNENDEDDKTFVTLYDRTGHVGKVEDTQCTGTDSLNTRTRVEMSYLYLMLSTTIEIIIIDGILATATWSPMINQIKTNQTIETNLILLNFTTPEANFARLKQRRANKTGQPVESIVLSENTEENVYNKLKNFKNMFEKVKGDFDNVIEIDAALPIQVIHEQIIKTAKL